jgi:hypothetical protein
MEQIRHMFHGVPPRSRGRVRARAAGVALLAVVSSTFALGGATTPARADAPRSCAWLLEVDPALVNVLYPDEAAHYWVLAMPLLPGESLVIHGQYPHSRYFSFTSYDPLLRSADGLHDTQIAPDPGSTNPFVVGASRGADRRSYTVHVVSGSRPAEPAANTLYTGSADGSRTNPLLATVIYRNYRQDRGLGDDGGVGLPSVTLHTAVGNLPIPTCAYPGVPGNTLNDEVADATLTAPLPPLLGSPTPVWRKFYNLPTSVGYALTTPLTGDLIGNLLAPLTMRTSQGGFADNPDNTYIATELSSSLGQVAVITARMPTFPPTYDGEPTMADGQLRYWSMCSEEFATTRYYGCVTDDEVPLGPDRTFTVMVSTADRRPANATTACGIAWLPAGPAPDTVMIERNMLPRASFTQSIQAARHGSERADLGPYYPQTRYLTTRQAEALGCHGGSS